MKLSVNLLFGLSLAILATLANSEDCYDIAGRKCLTEEEVHAKNPSVATSSRYFTNGDNPCFPYKWGDNPTTYCRYNGCWHKIVKF